MMHFMTYSFSADDCNSKAPNKPCNNGSANGVKSAELIRAGAWLLPAKRMIKIWKKFSTKLLNKRWERFRLVVFASAWNIGGLNLAAAIFWLLSNFKSLEPLQLSDILIVFRRGKVGKWKRMIIRHVLTSRLWGVKAFFNCNYKNTRFQDCCKELFWVIMVMVTENWTCLVFEWSNVVRSQNGPVFEYHLNTGLNLVKYSGHHFEYQTSEYPTSKS